MSNFFIKEISSRNWGQIIYTYRKERNWTMQKMGDHLGVTRSSINSYEKHNVVPSGDVIEKLYSLSDKKFQSYLEFAMDISYDEIIKAFLIDISKIEDAYFTNIVEKLLEGLRDMTYMFGREGIATSLLEDMADIDKCITLNETYLELCRQHNFDVPKFDFENDIEYRTKILPEIIKQYNLK